MPVSFYYVQEELTQARSQIEELDEQNSNLKTELDSKNTELEELANENEEKAKEISSLRDRTNLSQQNWLKEKDEFLEQESYLQSEYEQAREAMHNWEVLAMEERSIRESLGEKVIDLEEQLVGVKDAYEKAAYERDNQYLRWMVYNAPCKKSKMVRSNRTPTFCCCQILTMWLCCSSETGAP